MLNPRTNLGSCPVLFLFPGDQFAMASPLELKMFAETIFSQLFHTLCRSRGRILPVIPARLGGYKELPEDLRAMLRRIHHSEAANEFVFDIRSNIILASIKNLAVLFRPAYIQALSSPFILRLLFRNFDFLCLGVFLPAVTLFLGTLTIQAFSICPFMAITLLVRRCELRVTNNSPTMTALVRSSRNRQIVAASATF